jgi:hypothetical protein
MSREIPVRSIAGSMLFAVLVCAASAAAQDLPCGIKPIPEPNCRIGNCVEGEWEQICPEDPTGACGIKPLPAVGCRINGCVDGRWQEICGDGDWVREPEPIPCGLRPLPPAGCRVGQCVEGDWEIECD